MTVDRGIDGGSGPRGSRLTGEVRPLSRHSKLSHAWDETEGETEMTYAIKAVAGRMADMDWNAGGNAEKAAWKRYTALAIMATIKGWDKKDVALEVFGPADPSAPVKAGKRPKVKTSKTFDNAYSLATKAVNAIPHFVNRTWDEVTALGVGEAQDMVIDLINQHMRALEVGGMNAYEPLAGLDPAMLAARLANDEAKAAEAEAAATSAAEAEAEAETAARDKAEAAPERTAAQAAIAALAEASLDDMMDVLAFVIGRVDVGTLKMVHRDIGAMVANMEAKADVIDGEAVDVTPAAGQLQIAAA